MSVTILGQPIRLIRPEKIHQHSAHGAWRPKRVVRCKTIKLSLTDKIQISVSMGFEFTGKEKGDS